jgi:hypothetical protein
MEVCPSQVWVTPSGSIIGQLRDGADFLEEFMMQAGMVIGFFTSHPMNRLLMPRASRKLWDKEKETGGLSNPR